MVQANATVHVHRRQPRPVCVDGLLQPCDRVGKGLHGEIMIMWFGGFEVAVRAPRHPRRGAQVRAPPHDHGNRGDVAEGAREGGEAGHVLHVVCHHHVGGMAAVWMSRAVRM